MKTYQVTNGLKALGPFENDKKAALTLINCVTDALYDGSDPTKWRIEELDDKPKDGQPKDVPELIPNYAAARDYLGMTDALDVAVGEANARTLCALDQLMTLAKAWNKADGFEPDWEDESHQTKFYPVFERKGGEWEFKTVSCADRIFTFNCHICFKTEKRAEQFGRQFIDLFREALK